MKAQLQIGENIAVIIIVLVLIVFGFVFYSKIEASSIRQQSRQFEELGTIELANIASGMAELKCTFVQVEDVSCIDLYKARAAASVIPDPEYMQHYFTLFGNAKIVVHEVYPHIRNTTVYENHYAENESMNAVQVPVTVYNAVNDTYAFGVLEVTKFYR